MGLASRGINNKIKWELKCSISYEDEHCLLYRAEFMGKNVQKEIITPRRKDGSFGEQKVYFFIDGHPRKFRTEEALIKAIKEG